MKQVVTNGIVLRRINYREADRIITYLSPDQGKIVVLARGVRKANSKLAGSIELFCSSQITYLPGRGNIAMLISARLIKNLDHIVRDLDRTQLAYGVLKLIDKTLEDASGGEYYELLDAALGFINDLNLDLKLTRLWIELQFLQIMGHSPNADTKTIKTAETDTFNFDFERMEFVASENGNFSANHVKLFLLALANPPQQLKRIEGVDKLIEPLSELTQLIMINNGYDKL